MSINLKDSSENYDNIHASLSKISWIIIDYVSKIKSNINNLITFDWINDFDSKTIAYHNFLNVLKWYEKNI